MTAKPLVSNTVLEEVFSSACGATVIIALRSRLTLTSVGRQCRKQAARKKEEDVYVPEGDLVVWVGEHAQLLHLCIMFAEARGQ
jgi:hypothetical protein